FSNSIAPDNPSKKTLDTPSPKAPLNRYGSMLYNRTGTSFPQKVPSPPTPPGRNCHPRQPLPAPNARPPPRPAPFSRDFRRLPILERGLLNARRRSATKGEGTTRG